MQSKAPAQRRSAKPLAACESAQPAQTIQHHVPRLLPVREVLSRVGICRTKMNALIRENQFPKQVRIGRRSLWPSPEIDIWIAERIKQRDTLAAAA